MRRCPGIHLQEVHLDLMGALLLWHCGPDGGHTCSLLFPRIVAVMAHLVATVLY